MKYCPNPECRYALRHREAQEYRDEAVTCADCGTELTTERPARLPARPTDVLKWKLALTLLGPGVVVWLAPKVPLPRIDWEAFGRLGASAELVPPSVFALGLSPVISAFLLVELAALCLPRWRAHRTGGPSGRGRLLRATAWLAFFVASVQAVGFVVYMQRVDVLVADARLSRLVMGLSLLAGTAALLAATVLLDRLALGGGFALMTTAFALAFGWPELRVGGEHLWSLISAPGGAFQERTVTVGAFLLAGAATALLLTRRAMSPVRLPACGLIPLGFTAELASLATLIGWPEPLGWALDGPHSVALHLSVIAASAVVFGILFNRPSNVTDLVPGTATRVTRGVALSAAYVVGLAGLGSLVGRQLEFEPFSLVAVVVIVALVLDVIAEAKAVGRHGELVPVWPEHRLYAVDGALDTLDRNGIPAVARSAHLRALWHFFAPYIPIQILVPRSRAEDASRLLHEHFSLARFF